MSHPRESVSGADYEATGHVSIFKNHWEKLEIILENKGTAFSLLSSLFFLFFSLGGLEGTESLIHAQPRPRTKTNTELFLKWGARSSFPPPRDLVHVKALVCGVRCPPHPGVPD